LGTPKSQIEIESLYSVKGNITMNRLRTFIKDALEDYSEQIKEILPINYLQDYKLPIRSEAIRTLHNPENEYMLKHARRRFIYEEFLLYQLKMHLYKAKRETRRQGSPISIDREKMENFIQSLSFKLTNSQRKALEEIVFDIESDKQMYRLLQGDVGSGK